jgi:hypothetical protein
MGKQKTMTLYERALEEGEIKGEFKNKLETARKMLYKGFSVSGIQDITVYQKMSSGKMGLFRKFIVLLF